MISSRSGRAAVRCRARSRTVSAHTLALAAAAPGATRARAAPRPAMPPLARRRRARKPLRIKQLRRQGRHRGAALRIRVVRDCRRRGWDVRFGPHLPHCVRAPLDPGASVQRGGRSRLACASPSLCPAVDSATGALDPVCPELFPRCSGLLLQAGGRSLCPAASAQHWRSPPTGRRRQRMCNTGEGSCLLALHGAAS